MARDIFLAIFGVRVGPSDHAIGTAKVVKATRAINLVPEGESSDVELLLLVKWLPSDVTRNTDAGREFAATSHVVSMFSR